MKFKLLPFNGKTVWQKNKPVAWFLLSLLLIYSVLKIIFYQYNYHLLFTGAENALSGAEKIRLIKWSLGADLLTILAINAVLLFSLFASRFISSKISSLIIIPAFVLINSFAVILNLVDIFYFRFHFQRASADLLYVVDHPLNRLMQQNVLTIFFLIAGIAGIIYLLWFLHKKLLTAFLHGNHGGAITFILFICILFFMASSSRNKILVPAYPMIQLKSSHLPFVQNSFHTFFYSVIRKGEAVTHQQYMADSECDSILPIRKKIIQYPPRNNKQNIVLFIMESVPYDFFDPNSTFKVNMPFFDSLLTKSSFYNNAFCYAHESNKGITAILAGIPTVSDIPVYHSAHINMPITAVGTALNRAGYRSLFCIGDEYDNFGFAKCLNWLGIDKYYSKEDIPNYKKLPAHTMGLQDEYVLDFFRQKIQEQQGPFFAVHYNISTHYPYDIPEAFAARQPANYTEPMKAMRYYDHSLQQFFNAVKNEAWFNQTKFIFCSDHWMFPEGVKGVYKKVSGFRIPVIVYDPAVNANEIIEQPVSQFDILGTVLATAGYKDSILSYGSGLPDTGCIHKVVFTKAGSQLYQAIDSTYVLGYNFSNNKAEYLFKYKEDQALDQNLVNELSAKNARENLTKKIQAFLQQTQRQKSGALLK